MLVRLYKLIIKENIPCGVEQLPPSVCYECVGAGFPKSLPYFRLQRVRQLNDLDECSVVVQEDDDTNRWKVGGMMSGMRRGTNTGIL